MSTDVSPAREKPEVQVFRSQPNPAGRLLYRRSLQGSPSIAGTVFLTFPNQWRCLHRVLVDGAEIAALGVPRASDRNGPSRTTWQVSRGEAQVRSDHRPRRSGCRRGDIVATEMVKVECGTSIPSPSRSPSPASDGAEVDALALWDDNGNGRINCAEARRHGTAPVSRGHPAYQYCETEMAMGWCANRPPLRHEGQSVAHIGHPSRRVGRPPARSSTLRLRFLLATSGPSAAPLQRSHRPSAWDGSCRMPVQRIRMPR